MNRASLFSLVAPALCGVVLGFCLSAAAATTNAPAGEANTNAVTAPKTADATNAAPVEAPIPQSIFIIPKQTDDGVDPFFPLTARFQTVRSTTTTTKPPPVADLVIKGFSGTLARPFVIINDKTFGIGETRELATPQGRARVHCLEIRLNEMALVDVNGERRELNYRPRK